MQLMEQRPTEYLTVEQIANEYGVGLTTVRTWIQKKELTAYRLGKRWKVKRDDLEKFIENKRNN